MISADRKVQHVFKKLVFLIVFVEDIVNIYLNNIYNIFFSLLLVCKCSREHWLYALPSNKRSQNSTNFQIHEDCVAMETESCISNNGLNMFEGLFVYALLLKRY